MNIVANLDCNFMSYFLTFIGVLARWKRASKREINYFYLQDKTTATFRTHFLKYNQEFKADADLTIELLLIVY